MVVAVFRMLYFLEKELYIKHKENTFFHCKINWFFSSLDNSLYLPDTKTFNLKNCDLSKAYSLLVDHQDSLKRDKGREATEPLEAKILSKLT